MDVIDKLIKGIDLLILKIDFDNSKEVIKQQTCEIKWWYDIKFIELTKKKS